MYEKIVVPLDGSKLSEVALPYAEELAAKMASDIVLLTVLESNEADQCEENRTYIRRMAQVTTYHVEKYTGETEATRVVTATRSGNPAEAILEYVKKGNLDLVVMASHGRSGFSRWAVGSVADKVVKTNARQPVMLIRGKKSRTDIREKRILKKALVPLDGSELGETVIPCISEIALKLQMKVTLLQVVSQTNGTYAAAETYLQGECRKLAGKGIPATYELRIGAVADEIIDLADELAFDLVAMSTHGRGGVSLWPLGSVAQKVFLGGNTPLLLVRQ